MPSDGFRPGPGGGTGPPSFAPGPLHFCGHLWFFAKIRQISDFFALPNFRKMAKFVTSIVRPNAKSASASGGLCPLAPWPGALYLGPAGGSSPRSPLKACATAPAMGPCFQIFRARTATAYAQSRVCHRLVIDSWLGTCSGCSSPEYLGVRTVCHTTVIKKLFGSGTFKIHPRMIQRLFIE